MKDKATCFCRFLYKRVEPASDLLQSLYSAREIFKVGIRPPIGGRMPTLKIPEEQTTTLPKVLNPLLHSLQVVMEQTVIA